MTRFLATLALATVALAQDQACCEALSSSCVACTLNMTEAAVCATYDCSDLASDDALRHALAEAHRAQMAAHADQMRQELLSMLRARLEAEGLPEAEIEAALWERLANLRVPPELVADVQALVAALKAEGLSPEAAYASVSTRLEEFRAEMEKLRDEIVQSVDPALLASLEDGELTAEERATLEQQLLPLLPEGEAVDDIVSQLSDPASTLSFMAPRPREAEDGEFEGEDSLLHDVKRYALPAGAALVGLLLGVCAAASAPLRRLA